MMHQKRRQHQHVYGAKISAKNIKRHVLIIIVVAILCLAYARITRGKNGSCLKPRCNGSSESESEIGIESGMAS